MPSKDGQWSPGNKNQQPLNRVRRSDDGRKVGSYGSTQDIARGSNVIMPSPSSKSQKETG